jgi:hypothetical protein
MELMVAKCMIILYMRGAYSTPSKVHLFWLVSSLACASAISNFSRQMLIIVLFCFAQVWELASPGLQKPLTRRFEGGLVNLAVALDDVDLTSGAVGKRDDLPGTLVSAHHHGVTVECLNEDDGLVRGHGKAIVICLFVNVLS